MKTLRILLLVLLAVLLPWRGAMAEVVHCAGAGTPGASAAAAGVHEHASVHSPERAPAQSLSSPTPSEFPHVGLTGLGAEASAVVDACNACTASCASPPLPAPSLKRVPALPVAVVAYPALNAPLPSHPSEGPERPPRRV